MQVKKNWFYYLSTSISIIGVFYILICSFSSLETNQQYPALTRLALVAGLLLLWLAVWLMARICVRFRLNEVFSPAKKWPLFLEAVLVLLVLGAAFYARLWAIRSFPAEPGAGNRMQYDIAVLFLQDSMQSLGGSYCDYVALFPDSMGYIYILKVVFQWFGASLDTAKYLNLVCATMSVLVWYRIARRLGGRIAGFFALLLAAFWPSQILYPVVLSREPVFGLFFGVSILLFLQLAQESPGEGKSAWWGLVRYILLGFLLAITIAIRPMGWLLVIAMILVLLPLKMRLPALPLNDISLMVRFLSHGWVRCILLILPCLLLTGVFSSKIELAVNRTLPSAYVSGGYALLSGANQETGGEYNEQDQEYLSDAFDETGSATQAQKACYTLAVERLKEDKKASVNLFAEKYERFWRNDDYAAEELRNLLDEQRLLDKQRAGWLSDFERAGEQAYAVLIFLAFLSLLFVWQGQPGFSYLISLLYLGMAGCSMVLGNRTGDLYPGTLLLILMAASAVGSLLREERRRRSMAHQEDQQDQEEELQAQRIREETKKQEETLAEYRKAALENVFDMEKALKEGHVIMTVSQAYGKGTEEESTKDSKNEADSKNEEKETGHEG